MKLSILIGILFKKGDKMKTRLTEKDMKVLDESELNRLTDLAQNELIRRKKDDLPEIFCPDCGKKLRYLSHVFWYCDECKCIKK